MKPFVKYIIFVFVNLDSVIVVMSMEVGEVEIEVNAIMTEEIVMTGIIIADRARDPHVSSHQKLRQFLCLN